MEFVAKLPIGKVNCFGRVSERTLKSLGIETVQDVLTKRVILYQLLSKRFFDFLLRVCRTEMSFVGYIDYYYYSQYDYYFFYFFSKYYFITIYLFLLLIYFYY